MPRNEENMALLERLLGYIKQNEAGGQIFFVKELNQAVNEDIVARFEADRDQEYKEFLEQCEEFSTELEKETKGKNFTFAELEENEQNLQRLQKWIAKIQKRDFLKTRKSQEAVSVFQNCRQRLQTYAQKVYAEEGMEITHDIDFLSEDAMSSEQEVSDDTE